ncbi:MAG: hypothetical protein NVSMB6_20520 [Burkholderiaceae bacterium]
MRAMNIRGPGVIAPGTQQTVDGDSLAGTAASVGGKMVDRAILLIALQCSKNRQVVPVPRKTCCPHGEVPQ